MSKFHIDSHIHLRLSSDEAKGIRNLLSASAKVVITTHHRPDGDAMGSSLGLYNYLLAKGFQVAVVVPSEAPDFLSWLHGSDKVINYEVDKNTGDELIKGADVIFCLDYNSLNRIDKMEDAVRSSPAKKILVDHHLDPDTIFDVSVSYQDVSSTSELIVDVIMGMGDTDHIDKKIAQCLYCGIMTDTNSFRYSSMKARTHRIVAGLIEAGAENYMIHEMVYDNATESRLRLLGHSLSERLVVLPEFNTAYIALSEKELDQFKYQTGDTEGFVNVALGIKGIRLAVFFSEKSGIIKISFRSKGDFSVKDLSSKYFNGGGHKNASGGVSELSLDNTVKKFLEILPLYKAQLTSS